MDFESLKSQVSGLTLYDLKAGVRKVQNAVMNLTEMESKVREATNADPWGAPSSLMMEIAQGTHNYQQLNEIMPMIYKRFTDKTSEEWRQIYKALQLLEFLVKNGSERVVDDARSHLSLLRMLKQFHFIDPNGKDQGVNVRNRSAELAKLLSDVEMIRSERKKARANKNKYGGVEGGAGLGGGFSSSSRYGGFGSESGGYGGYQGEVYGDGGGFGGRETDFSGTQRRGDQFEEYDEEEEGSTPARATRATAAAKIATPKKDPPKPKEPERDLFDFGDDEPVTSTSQKAPANTFVAMPTNTTNDDDDDFDDFQSATSPAATTQSASNPLASLSPHPAMSTTTSSTQFAAPRPVQASQATNFNNLFSTATPPPASVSPVPTSAMNMSSQVPLQAKTQQPIASRSVGPNYYTSVRADINMTASGAPAPFSAKPITSPTQPAYGSSTSAASLGKPTTKPTSGAGGDAFSSLWSTASTKAGVQSKPQASKGPDLASMAKAKSEAGIWGTSSTTSKPSTPSVTQQKPATPLGNGLDDLLG